MADIEKKYSIMNLETKGGDTAKIRLTVDPWCDIMYSYTTISFDEQENEDESAVLKFEYIVHDPEEFDINTYSEEEQKEFETLLGDVLVNIISESLKNHEENETC